MNTFFLSNKVADKSLFAIIWYLGSFHLASSPISVTVLLSNPVRSLDVGVTLVTGSFETQTKKIITEEQIEICTPLSNLLDSLSSYLLP